MKLLKLTTSIALSKGRFGELTIPYSINNTFFGSFFFPFSKPVDHATGKALLAGFAGGLVDKL